MIKKVVSLGRGRSAFAQSPFWMQYLIEVSNDVAAFQLTETYDIQDHTSQDHFCSVYDELPVRCSENNPAAMMWIVPFPERPNRIGQLCAVAIQ